MKCTAFRQSSKVETNKISTAPIFKIWFMYWYSKKKTRGPSVTPSQLKSTVQKPVGRGAQNCACLEENSKVFHWFCLIRYCCHL